MRATNRISESLSAPIRIYLVQSPSLLSAGLRACLAGMPEVGLLGETNDLVRARAEVVVQLPDVVVVDESVGPESLDDLLRHWSHSPARLRVLVVAHNPVGDGALRALRAGAAGYLPATSDLATLTDAIHSIAAGELVFSSTVMADIADVIRSPAVNSNDPVMLLTDREKEVFLLTGQGFEAKEIGHRLTLSSRTVDVHRANIRNKLGITGTHELMRYAMHWEENQRIEGQLQAFCRERRPLLLVEDDEVDVLSVTRALKELRAETQVAVVGNGEEALDYLRDPARQRPFLILLDINLPRMNGPEFLAELRRDSSLAVVPVVVLTSSPDEADKERIYRLGVTGYFVKPSSSREFMQLFRTLAQYWGCNARPTSPA